MANETPITPGEAQPRKRPVLVWIIFLFYLVSCVQVIVAMFFLVSNVFTLLFLQTQDPFNFRLFQAIFDMVLTVLIAMEFNNSIVRTMEEEGRLGGFIHVEVVVLIAIMAVVRKFMVMDVEGVDPFYLLGLGGAILALGATYWLLKKSGADQ